VVGSSLSGFASAFGSGQPRNDAVVLSRANGNSLIEFRLGKRNRRPSAHSSGPVRLRALHLTWQDKTGSKALKALIAELQTERRKLPNVDGLVFTLDGQTIDEFKLEYHFRRVRKAAGIKHFTFHDFRHCAITRWGAEGIPTAAAMLR